MATVTPEQMKKALSSLSALEGMASGYCELQDGFDTSKGIAENVRQVLAALAATPAEARTFPIQSERAAKPHPTRIPWWLADLAYSVYRARFGSGQSLERLAERGGFHPSEMDEYVPDWRELAAQAPPASDPPGLVANWRPIETAPKRTDVLAGWADRPHWLPQVLQQDDAGMWFNGEESDYRPPTHWMPLPASPQAETMPTHFIVGRVDHGDDTVTTACGRTLDTWDRPVAKGMATYDRDLVTCEACNAASPQAETKRDE